MKKSIILKSLLFAISLPLLAGCVVYAPPPDADAPPPPQTDVITVAPGPPDVWFWVPGAWGWNGGWVWGPGHWAARPHPGAVWVGGDWGYHGGHRAWVRGHWR